MFDNYSYLSGELRHLAFRKSGEQTTWKDAVKQHMTDSEDRLVKLANNNFLADISKALLLHFNHGIQASPLVNDLPSHPKAG
jgi:hypothetical protein